MPCPRCDTIIDAVGEDGCHAGAGGPCGGRFA